MNINLTAGQSLPIRADAFDAFGNPAVDTFTWSCEPSSKLQFVEGGGQSASGPQVTLRSVGPTGAATVTVVSGSNQTASAIVQIAGGPAATIDIVPA